MTLNPKFENKGVKYIFTFPDFTCAVSRIHVEHDRTSCQFLFTNPTDNTHILRTRLNIETETAARKRLANDLSERYPAKDLNWQDTIEYIVEKTMRELEHGEPVITLKSTDEIAELEYLVYPIIPKGKPTAIFGDPEAGKTQLAVILSIIMLLPWRDNPLRLGAPACSVKTLLLDYEGESDDISRHIIQTTEGMRLGFCQLEYRHCSLPIANDLEGIRNYIDDLNIQCLIIDSVSQAAGGDLNNMATATNYIRALRSLGNLTTISMAHTSKDRESKIKTILGSVLFEAGFRSVWEQRANEGDDCLDIALFHRKANLSRKFPAIGFRINYEKLGNTIEWLNPKSVPEFVERMSANQRILDALKRGKLSTLDLVEQLDIKRSTFDSAVYRLRKANKIMGDPNGWGLATPPDFPLL